MERAGEPVIGGGAAAAGETEAAGPFPFVGGALAIDFANTGVVVRRKAVELWAGLDELVAWWEAAGARYPELGTAPPASDDRLLVAATALRAALRDLLGAAADRHTPDPVPVAALNRVLATGRELVVPAPFGRLRRVVRAADDGPSGVLLPVARSALAVLTKMEPGRLHRCGNERCVLLFYDTTKSATRRWCSVGCMNRARSSKRYRERKRLTALARF